jgi:hypothetical protein
MIISLIGFLLFVLVVGFFFANPFTQFDLSLPNFTSLHPIYLPFLGALRPAAAATLRGSLFARPCAAHDGCGNLCSLSNGRLGLALCATASHR